jgi:predicted anti-sigma-YlaC factor YlaD
VDAAQCDRARQWVSLRLDGAISALETALLEKHLRVCVECRAFAANADAQTRLIRSAPLVPLSAPVVLPYRGRRGRTFAFHAVAGAAAVAAAVITAVILGATAPRPVVGPQSSFVAAPVLRADNLGVQRFAVYPQPDQDAGFIRGELALRS